MSKSVVRLFVLLCVLGGLLQLFSCGGGATPEGSFYSFTDSTGREVKLNSQPTRVAVLFSSYAEIWQLSGGNTAVTVADSVERGFADSSAVIVDSGSGHTHIDTELLLSSSPDFVIGTADYPVQVSACEFMASKGIPSALFKVESFEDYLYVLDILTDISGEKDRYAEYGTAVKARIDTALAAVSDYRRENSDGTKDKMLFLRSGSSQRSTKAKKAEDHFACAMLEELGLYNIADNAPVLLDGLSVEEIVRENPYRIFVSMMGENTDAVINNVNTLFSKDGYSTLDAVTEGRVTFLPKNLFHYKPNHRWAEAYEYLIQVLYPEIDL